MSILKININSFKKDLGGIANRVVDSAINKVEQRLENAVEDAFAKGLKKIGLSNGVARELSSRFTDSISVGRADDFFKSSTAEQNRVSKQQIEDKLLPGLAETTFDAIQKINTTDITSAPVMQFPDVIGEYFMVLDFQSYSRPSPQMEAKFKRFKTIRLPIPRDLKESFELKVGDKEQGLAGGLADVGVDILRGAGDRVKSQEFALLYSAVVQAVEGNFADILGQAFGAVPNPHLQAIFSGIDLRSHTFQWTFAPRNPQESRNLKAIINEIKKNSLPAYSTTGTAALQYPPMVDIKLMPWAENPEDRSNDLIQFKKCLVKSVSVNYAPAGLPSFFRGTNLPTMIQLELQLLETEIQTARDYSLPSGARKDGIEQFKDLVDKSSNKLGEALGVDVAGAKNQLRSALDKTYNTASRSAQQATRNRGE